MFDVKRFMLVLLILSILAGSLIFTSGAAHAQDRVNLLPHQSSTVSSTLIATDSGYNYAFNAGWWGWGICLSHNTTQGIFGSASDRGILYALVGVKVPNPWVVVAAAGAEWIIGHIQGLDHGRGVCMAWPYYVLSSVPLAWWPQ